jgi:hypothetical protein
MKNNLEEEDKPLLPGCENIDVPLPFNTKVFQTSEKSEQEVCDFVLMLALIYNDFKDLSWAYVQMSKCKSPTSDTPNSYQGQYAGIKFHLTKTFHSLIFEFAGLIRKNPDVINHPLFVKTLKKIGKENKNDWTNLLSFARGEADEELTELYEVSCLIRNNISSHYHQPKFLSMGYNYYFSKKDTPSNSHAFVSAGESLEATRFYFADAAIQGCFEKNISREKANKLNLTLKNVSEKINKSLNNIITSFIKLRLDQLKDVSHEH